MDTKEAKTLVISTLKTYKLEKRRETVHVVGPIAGLLVGSNLITLAITIPATIAGVGSEVTIITHTTMTLIAGIGLTFYFFNEYNPDYKLKEKIDMLKQLKNELKNGVNRFENIDVSNFNNELENQFKKLK